MAVLRFDWLKDFPFSSREEHSSATRPRQVLIRAADSNYLLSPNDDEKETHTLDMSGRLQLPVALIISSGSGLASNPLGCPRPMIQISSCGHRLQRGRENFFAGPKLSADMKPVAIGTDVGVGPDVIPGVKKAVESFGRVDVMFSKVGLMHPANDNASSTDEKIWALTMQINVKGIWWGCNHAMLAMRRNEPYPSKNLTAGGCIINTASFVAIIGCTCAVTFQIAYTASKGAVLGSWRWCTGVKEYEVNAICPGPPETPSLMDFLNTPEKRDKRMVHLPMGRFGEAIEVARGVLFLASDESSYVTGTDFLVDGGLSASYVTPTGEQGLTTQ